MDILGTVVAFGVGVAIAYTTTFGFHREDLSAVEQRAVDERWKNADHVPLQAYAYAFFALLLVADCAAHDLGGHFEQHGRDDGEFVQDWQPTYAQRWRVHEKMEGDRFMPLLVGVGIVDASLRIAAARRKKREVL